MIKKLVKVQGELKAPKNQMNKFGGYKYRSCEDILEAVKPLLVREELLLTITDEVIEIGGRVYVKATATVTDGTTTISNSALAREEETRKGMDSSQITGATSSYARKYALNGLFCIDDTKDMDTEEYQSKGKSEPKKEPKKAESYRDKVIALAKEKGIGMQELSQDYKLSAKTTEERFKEVYEDLGGK